ncbi:MAG: helix-turn-helix transcriptional regulator [Bdellovibrionaceae bacterium]|nr:helix-turn-helix transcriptional regulator [Pseudobdellovibrionaceae bacterium]
MTVKKKHIGEFFKSKRIQKGLTQSQVAELLGYSSPQIVSNWERLLCDPPIEKLSSLAKILGIPKKELIKMMTGSYQEDLKQILSK